MTDFLDRLEQELMTAGRRHQERPARSSVFGRPRRLRVSGALPVIVSLAVTAVVVAIVLASGIIHGSSQPVTGNHGNGPNPTGPATPKVIEAPACRPVGRVLTPAPKPTDGAPSGSLRSILTIARDKAGGEAYGAIQGFQHNSPLRVLTVYRRYIRVVAGERGARVAVFPAIFCDQRSTGKSPLGSPIRIDPEEAMMMVVLGDKVPSLIFQGSTAADIREGSALYGRSLPNGQWMEAAVVPDGVAKIVMHFTPPFLHHYSATATVHDNVGIVVRRVPYAPTSVSWYDAAGHQIHTYVDKANLKYENCLAQHRKDCTN